jgi:hypothetical protein
MSQVVGQAARKLPNSGPGHHQGKTHRARQRTTEGGAMRDEMPGPPPPAGEEPGETTQSRRRRNKEGQAPTDTSVVVYEGPPTHSRYNSLP